MKRRRFFQSLALAPAAPALLAQRGGAPGAGAAAAESAPQIEMAFAEDAGAETVLRFFTAPQMAALRKLSGILMPALNGAPSALECHASEFLDFLLSESAPLPERQLLYRAGLDGLNAQATKQFKRPFAQVDVSQADTLLASLKQPWTYDHPVDFEVSSDPVPRFLRTVKADLRTATVNSREYALAGTGGGGGRRGGGGGFGNYVLPIE